MLFKPSQVLQRAKRRLQLTTKNASVGGGYYKGNRTGSMGWHTKHGGYIIDLRKVRTYVAPKDIFDGGNTAALYPFVPEDPNEPKDRWRKRSKLAADREARRIAAEEAEEAALVQEARAGESKGQDRKTAETPAPEPLREDEPLEKLDGPAFLKLLKKSTVIQEHKERNEGWYRGNLRNQESSLSR